MTQQGQSSHTSQANDKPLGIAVHQQKQLSTYFSSETFSKLTLLSRVELIQSLCSEFEKMSPLNTYLHFASFIHLLASSGRNYPLTYFRESTQGPALPQLIIGCPAAL